MMKRRHVLAALAAVPILPSSILPGSILPSRIQRGLAQAATPAAIPALPIRYDEPLGIGLEGWPYPAPVHFFQTTVAGQAHRMAYMDIAPTGPARSRAIVLLHGKNFDSSYWAGPIKDLAGAGYRVIVPDQFGFNKSAKPEIAYSFDLLVAATLDLLLGSLQIQEFAVLGHSTGGMLAVRLVTSAPSRVTRLILEDPVGLVDYREFIPPQSFDTLYEAELKQTVASYRTFVKRFFPLLPGSEYEPFVEWRMRVALSSEYERFCKAAASTYEMIYREPVRSLYRDIKTKSLIIAGTADQSAPLKAYAAPAIAAKMPGIFEAAPGAVKDMGDARLVPMDKAGHVPHLEAPSNFRDAVLGFLSG